MNLSILGTSDKWNHTVTCPFVTGLFHPSCSMYQNFLSCLNNIPLCVYTTFFSTEDSWALCSFWTLCIVLLGSWVSDGIRSRPGEWVCLGLFLSSFEVTQLSCLQSELPGILCRSALIRCASPRVRGAGHPLGCICPEGSPFCDLH